MRWSVLVPLFLFGLKHPFMVRVTTLVARFPIPSTNRGKRGIDLSMIFHKPRQIDDPPLLVFPGLGATKLMDGNRTIYPPPIPHYLLNFQDWKSMMIDRENLSTLDFGDPKSLDVNLPFRRLNIYERILHEHNVHAMPYDFRRLDNPDYYFHLYDRVRHYIESFDRPVLFMCHSTGGLVAHWFLHNQPKEWLEKWIKGVLYVNVPFGGVVTILENCVSEETNINRYIGPEIFKSLGASIWNMPNVETMGQPVLYVDDEPVYDYMEFFEMRDVKVRYEKSANVIASFSQSVDHVESYVMYSIPDVTKTTNALLVNTKTKIKTKSKSKCSPPKILTKLGEGDGVVPMKSLMVPKLWKKQPIYIPMPGTEHSSLLKNPTEGAKPPERT